MEIAHRLFLMPGKCQQIHGHSMQVSLTLYGDVNENGVFEGRDFGGIKKVLRAHLDNNYDHHLLLNENDPWARPLAAYDDVEFETPAIAMDGFLALPGLVTVPGDPTTENLALWISAWAAKTFCLDADVTIDETGTNSFSAGATWAPPGFTNQDRDILVHVDGNRHDHS